MLMRLDLVLTTGAAGRMATGLAAGLVGEDKEDTKSPGVIYILNRYNSKPLAGLCSYCPEGRWFESNPCSQILHTIIHPLPTYVFNISKEALLSFLMV